MKPHTVNIKEILEETSRYFTKSKDFKEKLSNSKRFIDKDIYEKLHPNPLTQTDIKINCAEFIQEIKQYENFFERWGKKHSHIPRYGLALVNTDGKLKTNDPINGSLYEYNIMNHNDSIIESDCRCKTKAMSIPSLAPLKIFDDYWYRSNILKWEASAEFFPHIDNFIPAPWIRLWGTTNPDIVLNFYHASGHVTTLTNMEPGRIYLIDTCLVHDAKILSNEVYQFFLCVSPESLSLIKEII